MPRRIIRDPATASMVAAVSVLALIAAGQAAWQSAHQPVAALSYPTQQVENHLAGDPHPAATIDQQIKVSGLKCNRSDAPVKIAGVSSWVSTEPPGSVIQMGRGSAVRSPGCQHFAYVNDIPPQVIARTRALIEASGGTRDYVTWTMAGTEVPDNRGVETESWTTEPFDLYLVAPSAD